MIDVVGPSSGVFLSPKKNEVWLQAAVPMNLENTVSDESSWSQKAAR